MILAWASPFNREALQYSEAECYHKAHIDPNSKVPGYISDRQANMYEHPNMSQKVVVTECRSNPVVPSYSTVTQRHDNATAAQCRSSHQLSNYFAANRKPNVRYSEYIVNDRLNSTVDSDSNEIAFLKAQVALLEHKLSGDQIPSARHSNQQNNYNEKQEILKPRLPIFSGKMKWGAFWVQFEMITDYYRWDSRQQLQQLIFSLRDEAADFVTQLSLTQRSDIRGLVDALKQRFGDHVLSETHRVQLQSAKKLPNENVQEYAYRIASMVSKSYPGIEGNQLHTNLTVEHILRGLPDTAMAYAILTKKTQTVQQAIDMISWHECCKISSGKRSSRRMISGENTLDDTEEEVEVRRVNGKRFVTEERLQQFEN